MITLIKKGLVFAPHLLGKKDLLLLGSKIGAIAEPGRITLKGTEIKTIDASGKTILPGIIDGHVHILGAGGEGGPTTRTPEITIEDIIPNGVTTIIGLLGTDAITRHLESLLAKARALEIEGITTYIFSGSYEIPVKTLTGSVRRDLVLIDKAIGIGEIAISDHRSSQPGFEEIVKLAADCRVGGLLSGKAGILHIHLGDGNERLALLFRLLKETEIPASQIIATHANRNRALLEESVKYVRAGGYIDLTSGVDPEEENDFDVSVETAVRLFLKAKAPLSRISVSSDSNGSFPVFNKQGNYVGMSMATQKDLFKAFRSLIKRKILDIENTSRLFSANPARFYKLTEKGEIKEGKDADLVILDKDLNITHVFAMGKMMMADGKPLAKGTFSTNV